MNQTNSTVNDESMLQSQKDIKLVDIPINDENTALNIMVSFLSLGQKRGVFTFDESAKIWECIKIFQK